MSHTIEDLRNRLFAALDGLADKKEPMEIDRARAIADVARVPCSMSRGPSASAPTSFRCP